ncbi:VOC family protein [Streptomyces sp. NBC_00841]|uniref:VOC family protein n=1 Tax=Streptomyces sp. NBC_00841 TaxID=2975847 RepID=UPI002DD85774|nr:VOC family protein [Streptomyces sp. NBC_00841]WRZ96995.1 VOC family protein [Streptomyces sp. NBC_00841]
MTAPDATPAVPGLPLDAAFDHVAVAARRIRDLLPLYRDTLGGEFYLGGDNARVGYRGLQLTFRGGGKVELLEPLAGSTFLDSFLRRNPLGGQHHVTFTVTDMPGTIAALEGLGYRVHGASEADPEWHEVFIHPREAAGTLLQLARPGPNYGRATTYTLDDVLAGKAPNGCGLPSP